MENIKLKVCKTCGQEKPITEYTKAKKYKDGFSIYCKLCERERNRNNWHRHREKYNAYEKKYRAEHKESIKQYFNIHKEELAEKAKIKRKENAEKLRAYYREKTASDKVFRTRKNISRLIPHAIHKKHFSKRMAYYFGCDFDTFKNHIEKQFRNGMNWSNYGLNGWVIDHIIPISNFDLKKESEILKCYNYKNIQPLWRKENSLKADKMPNGKSLKEL